MQTSTETPIKMGVFFKTVFIMGMLKIMYNDGEIT